MMSSRLHRRHRRYGLMDNYRRRPPMEGFSRPGQLGGEAFDDDEVEGHIMSDQPEETQKDAVRRNDDDTEGHGGVFRKATDDDDTEGHGGVFRKATDDDDTEGHGGVFRKATDDDDDTEGHSSLRNLR
jgi:hypothetical protein